MRRVAQNFSLFSEEDLRWMRRALSKARQAMGRTSPNPAVGAVIVREGKVVGEGYTHPPGGPHAEVVALHRAGSLAQGATLYVTLEPCAHYGRTPPCVSAILQSGVRRVVSAMEDPHPLVRGQGFQQLREQGIKVEVGLLEEEARRINLPYLKHLQSGLPFVLYKVALSLDGKIATACGDSHWISSETSRRHVHLLRRKADVVMVGIGTVLKDDPLLTPRPPGRARPGYPKRVILDTYAQLPLSAQVLTDTKRFPTLVAVSPSAPREKITALQDKGAQILFIEEARPGYLNLHSLLKTLGDQGLQSVLLEGGGELASSFLQEGLIDQVAFFIAPLLLGGRDAKTPIEGEGVRSIKEAWRLREVTFRRMGPDLLVEGYLTPLIKHKGK